MDNFRGVALDDEILTYRDVHFNPIMMYFDEDRNCFTEATKYGWS